MRRNGPNDAAFPRPCGRANDEEQSLEQDGMTMREYFAAAALSGYLAAHSASDQPFPRPSDAAAKCFAYADAMLAESRKE